MREARKVLHNYEKETELDKFIGREICFWVKAGDLRLRGVGYFVIDGIVQCNSDSRQITYVREATF